jgi:hypothetical protein
MTLRITIAYSHRYLASGAAGIADLEIAFPKRIAEGKPSTRVEYFQVR